MRLLLVEDEPGLARALRAGLAESGFAVDVAPRLDAALRLADEHEYDLVLLDRRLPDGDGMQLCAAFRERGARAPILMLTARDTIEERVEGLNAGADDYLVKPFAFSELLARAWALLRRDAPSRGPLLRAGAVELDPGALLARVGGREVRLNAREFAILHYLMTRAGEVVRRGEIEEHCWDRDFDARSNVVDVYVARLRRALGSECPIETVRGVGYRVRREARTSRA